MAATNLEVSKTFRVLTIITFIVVVLALLPVLAAMVLVWLPGDVAKDLYADDFAIHRVHAIALSVASWVLVGSIATQLHKPQRKIATMLLGLAAMLTFIPLDLVSGTFIPLEIPVLGLIIAMLWFHPQRGILQWRPLDRAATAVVVVGAIPWVLYAWGQLQAQTGGPTDVHGESGHYGATATMMLIVLAAVAIGSTSLPGWRASLAMGAFGAATYGVVSIILPDAVSSGGLSGGLAIALWAGALGAITLLRSVETDQLPVAQPTIRQDAVTP